MPSALSESQADLRRMERRDWSRLTVFLTIVGLLTVAVWILTSEHPDFMRGGEIHVAITGLVAIVLLFGLFSVYQQRITIELRRKLAANIAMAATLEVLKPAVATSPARETRCQRRHFRRYYFDEVVRVHGGADHSLAPVFGRTSNLGEGGLAAVLPQQLEPGATVVAEFSAGPGGEKLSCSAVVRYRRGYLHGLEFVHVGAEQRQMLQRICERGAPVDFEPVTGAPAPAENAGTPRSTAGVPAH